MDFARQNRYNTIVTKNIDPIFILGGITMKSYVCDVCGYIYDPAAGDPDNGIAPGTAFEDIPADWVCPLCGVGKNEFSVQE